MPINPNQRVTQQVGNLPINDANSEAIIKARDEALAQKAKIYKGQQKAKRTKWVKVGLQPAATGGFNLVIDHYDGEKKLKTTVKKGLSPFAAREQLALHMSALYEGF